MIPMTYDRAAAVAYAHEWAFSRNPLYYDFSAIGGDCTNFISQCLYAGAPVMNYTLYTGWYYNSLQSRSPSWTGVEYFYQFLINNSGKGPYGRQLPLQFAQPGDFIQLNLRGDGFGHSLIVVRAGRVANPSNILIATHTTDSDNRPLNTYNYLAARLLIVDGVRG